MKTIDELARELYLAVKGCEQLELSYSDLPSHPPVVKIAAVLIVLKYEGGVFWNIKFKPLIKLSDEFS